jgi:hypothetical protein
LSWCGQMLLLIRLSFIPAAIKNYWCVAQGSSTL